MPTKQDFIAAARAYLGVRYRHLGRSKKRGVDCVGLLICAANDCGLRDGLDFREYKGRPQGRVLEIEMNKHAKRIAMPDRAVGDILMFMGIERLPCHLVLITEQAKRTMVIHAWGEIGFVAEHPLEGSSLKAPIGCFRLPEFING